MSSMPITDTHSYRFGGAVFLLAGISTKTTTTG
jgi:hypothetical protein